MITNVDACKSRIASKKVIDQLNKNRSTKKKKQKKNPGFSYGTANAPMKTLVRK